MKPPPFAYSAPRSLEETLEVLDREEEAKVLAGGQSLIPLLNMRLAAPAHLVDINRASELRHISVGEDAVVVGALARHAEVEAHEGAARALPLLRQALRLVAHPVIRNRGTTCGSIAHADPAGEMTAVISLVGGTINAASASGAREIAARDFFAGPLENTLRRGELITSVRFPRLLANTGTAFREVARRHGDYALAGVAAAVSLDDDLRVAAAKVAYISVSPTPLVLDLTDELAGQRQPTADWQAAARRAASDTEPEPDIHATAEYRRHLATVLTARALAEAAHQAAASATGAGASEPKGRGVAWTEERRTRRGKAAPDGAPEASGGQSTSDEGRRRLAAPRRRAGSRSAPGAGEEHTASEEHTVNLTLNGLPRSFTVPARRLLSDALRHDLSLAGTHVGCEHGVCGCCTVLLDGRPVRSCLTFAVTVDGASVTTVEGLAGPGGALHPLQQAFHECHGLQCGFCTPGMLMTLKGLLDTNPDPSREEVVEAISGNLCRCTGYQNIIASGLRAAELARQPAERASQPAEPAEPSP